MDSCAATALPGQDVQMAYGQKSKVRYVRSPSNIDWHFPLKDQLEPQLKGGPDPTKTFEELCMLRNSLPKLDDDSFKKIFQAPNTACYASLKRRAPGVSSI